MHYVVAILFVFSGLLLIGIYFNHKSKKVDKNKFSRVTDVITKSFVEESFSYNTGRSQLARHSYTPVIEYQYLLNNREYECVNIYLFSMGERTYNKFDAKRITSQFLRGLRLPFIMNWLIHTTLTWLKKMNFQLVEYLSV